MSAGPAAYRCAVASGLRDDALAGTASTVRAFLLVEHAGAWGVDALRDARLPEGLGDALRERARAAGVRVLLARRHRQRQSDDGPTRVLAAHAHPHHPRLEAATLDDPRDLLDLDLAALRTTGSLGWEPHPGPVLATCTHGRHDACCAERGRPVAAALAAAHPDHAWEVSHIGGDRFAANLLVLPHGLYYGRLDPVRAIAVGAGHLSGQLDLDHLRGRSGWAMPVQAAEIALRRDLGETRVDALRLTARSVDGDTTAVTFEVGGAAYDVVVRSVRDGGTAGRLTCGARAESPVPRHDVLEVRRRT